MNAKLPVKLNAPAGRGVCSKYLGLTGGEAGTGAGSTFLDWGQGEWFLYASIFKLSVRICDPTTHSGSWTGFDVSIHSCSFLPFISEWFPFRIWTCHLSNLSLVFTPFTSVHLLEIHLSHFLLIILSMHLDITWTSLRLMFYPYLLCSAIVVFKIFLYLYPQNLHCFFLSFSCFDLSLSPLCLL